MQITEELKKKLANAKTEDERSAILADAKSNARQAGIELEDAELNEAAGGGPIFGRKYAGIEWYECPACQRTYDEGGKCVCGATLISV